MNIYMYAVCTTAIPACRLYTLKTPSTTWYTHTTSHHCRCFCWWTHVFESSSSSSSSSGAYELYHTYYVVSPRMQRMSCMFVLRYTLNSWLPSLCWTHHRIMLGIVYTWITSLPKPPLCFWFRCVEVIWCSLSLFCPANAYSGTTKSKDYLIISIEGILLWGDVTRRTNYSRLVPGIVWRASSATITWARMMFAWNLRISAKMPRCCRANRVPCARQFFDKRPANIRMFIYIKWLHCNIIIRMQLAQVYRYIDGCTWTLNANEINCLAILWWLLWSRSAQKALWIFYCIIMWRINV